MIILTIVSLLISSAGNSKDNYLNEEPKQNDYSIYSIQMPIYNPSTVAMCIDILRYAINNEVKGDKSGQISMLETLMPNVNSIFDQAANQGGVTGGSYNDLKKAMPDIAKSFIDSGRGYMQAFYCGTYLSYFGAINHQ